MTRKEKEEALWDAWYSEECGSWYGEYYADSKREEISMLSDADLDAECREYGIIK